MLLTAECGFLSLLIVAYNHTQLLFVYKSLLHLFQYVTGIQSEKKSQLLNSNYKIRNCNVASRNFVKAVPLL